MTPADPAIVATAPVPIPADPGRALIAEQIAMLGRLARIGMEVAEVCGRQATGQEPTPAGRDPALVFARVARSVRMTIALQSRLAKDLAALDRANEAAQMARRDEHRMRLRILVGQAVSASIDPDDARSEDVIEYEIERLSDDAYERLTEAEDGDPVGRPFDEVVAGICKDLRLSPDWTARVRRAVEAPAGSSPLPPPSMGEGLGMGAFSATTAGQPWEAAHGSVCTEPDRGSAAPPTPS